MSIIVSTDCEGTGRELCPKCSEPSVSAFIAVPEKALTESGFTFPVASTIAPKGKICVSACRSCGFKWIPNDAHFTSSQLVSFIFSSVLRELTSNMDSEKSLDANVCDMLDLLYTNKIIDNKAHTKIMQSNKNAYERALQTMLALTDGLDNATASELINLYNDVLLCYDEDKDAPVVEEAVFPDTHEMSSVDIGISADKETTLIDD